MKYKPQEEVVLKNTLEIKKIQEIELIVNQPIYYMSDKTSYHENQIGMLQSQFKELQDNSHLFYDVMKNHFVDALNTYWDNRIKYNDEQYFKNILYLYIDINKNNVYNF